MIILYTHENPASTHHYIVYYCIFVFVRFVYRSKMSRLYAFTHKDRRLVVYKLYLKLLIPKTHNLLYVNYSLTSKLTCNRERIMYYAWCIVSSIIIMQPLNHILLVPWYCTRRKYDSASYYVNAHHRYPIYWLYVTIIIITMRQCCVSLYSGLCIMIDCATV